MRRASDFIWDTWNRGLDLIGPRRACTRVTVEPDWYLTTHSPAGRPKKKNPVRWYQRAGNDQEEVEIPAPFIRKVDMDRSIDTDAAECTIVMLNTAMEVNGVGGERVAPLTRGIPGYFTFDHGDNPGPWGHVKNEWYDVILPGALIRTYQGYGGHAPKTIPDAVEDGNLILTGVWIVDDVQPAAKGELSITMRDVGALLIDQMLYPPLVPRASYPLQYRRWIYSEKTIKPLARYLGNLGSPTGQKGRKRLKYATSSVDAWYGPNATIHGHKGTDSVDGNPQTYALGEGSSSPEKAFANNYWEYECGETINELELTAWSGPFDTYISIMEGGRWQGASVVPYDHTPLIGNQPHVVDTGADIPYVMKFGSLPDRAQRFKLPRAYKAQRVRIGFRNLKDSGIGPWRYRGGIRDVAAFFSTAGKNDTGDGESIPLPEWVDLEMHPDGFGYYALRADGWVETFGDARRLGRNGIPYVYGDGYPKGKDLRGGAVAVSVVASPTGLGYAVLLSNGKLFRYGDFVGHGDIAGDTTGAIDIVMTHTGDGYWITTHAGSIAPFGDAPDYTNFDAPIVDTAGNPADYGLWAVGPGGVIQERGTVTAFGDASRLHPMLDFSGIEAVNNGDGVLAVEQFGAITGRGDFPAFGDKSGFPPPPYPDSPGTPPKEPRISALAVGPTSGGLSPGETLGYATLTFSGHLFTFGEFPDLGEPAGGTAVRRRPGDYKDYSDIIKDLLLWAGWYLKNGDSPGAKPNVYGNIEQTGVYSEETLNPDFFDKKAVIEPITEIKQVVAYNFYIDPEGGARFEAPNFWEAGNFWEDGTPTDEIPTVDERVNMTDYHAGISRRAERSSITVASTDPIEKIPGTIATTVYPANRTAARSFLRGMVRPAMIGVPISVTKREQKIMAELTALRIFFARRQGSVSCIANPAICIDDQVRILERNTGEVYIHYVRGVRTSHDLKSGTYTMDLTTHWMGTDKGDWAIVYDGSTVRLGQQGDFAAFRLSADATKVIERTTKGRGAVAAASATGVVDLVDVDTLTDDDGQAT